MTLVVNVDGVDLTDHIEVDGISLSYGADSEPHFGGFTIHDPDAEVDVTDDIRGLRQITINETACTDAPRLWTGFVEERRVRRGTSEKTDGARVIEVDTLDANEVFGKRLLWEETAKRPAETVGTRLNWIKGSGQLAEPGIWQIHDNGEIDFSSDDLNNPMDEADYRGQKYGDVLSDILNAVTMEGDFYIYFDQVEEELSLHMGRGTTTVGTSTLKLSNDPDDWDFDGAVILNTPTITFPILIDHDFTRTPAGVYSRVRVETAGGTAYTKGRASTATTYTSRGININNTLIRSAATADSWMNRYLDAHDQEADSIKVTTILPATHVGLIDAGQRISCKFVHLAPEVYDSFTFWRVRSKTVRMPIRQDFYYVDLELVRGSTGLSGGGGGSGGGSEPGDFPHPPPAPCPDWDPEIGGVFTLNGSNLSAPYSDDVNPDWYLNVYSDRRYHWQFDVTGTGGPGVEVSDTLAVVHRTTHTPFIYQGAGGIGGMQRGTPTGSYPFVPYQWGWASDAAGTTYNDPPLDVYGTYTGTRCDGPFNNGTKDTGSVAFRPYDASAPHTTTFSVTITVRVYDCDGNLLECDNADETAPDPGQVVPWEAPTTVTPTGGVTDIVTKWPYYTGSLQVKVNGILISPASIVEDDPAAGTFHLIWQIDADETVLVQYQGI